MNMPALSLRAVKLPRGSIGELAVDFAPGVHVIVGPNGIGKTSLLNSIAGTLPPVSGSILLGGQPLGEASARVILAPNAPPDIPWIRSGLLLDFVLSLYPATRRDAAFAVATLERFGLTTFMDAPLGTLSAGGARKLLLAAALIAAPPVMLFDEPTNDIDAPSSAAFVEMIGAAAREHIVIVTTHHTQDLASLQPRVLDLSAVRV
jgi:ABC-type multidrug transport system ATPase subunit